MCRPIEASVHQLALFEIELPSPPPPSAMEIAGEAMEMARKAMEIARKAKEIAEIAALGGKCITCGEREVRRLRLDYGQYGRNPPRVICCSCRRRR